MPTPELKPPKVQRISRIATGYHYTSLHNWSKIRRKGLTPSKINQPTPSKTLNRYYPDGVSGVWIWTKNPNGRNDLIAALMTASQHGVTQLVKIKVKYNWYSDLLYFDNNRVTYKHDVISFEHLLGQAGAQSHILIKHIPPDQLEAVRIYDLMDIVRYSHQP